MKGREPPGRLGFPFIGESASFASDVLEFAKVRHEEHGPVWKTRLATWKCVFITGMKEALHVAGQEGNLCPHLSVSQSPMSLVEPLYGKGFYLHDHEHAQEIRKEMSMLLNEDAIGTIFFPDLVSHLEDMLQSCIQKKEEDVCVYSISKVWLTQALTCCIFGVKRGSEDAASIASWSNDLFRALSSVPLQFIGMGFSRGHQSRALLVDKIESLVSEELLRQGQGDSPSKSVLGEMVKSLLADGVQKDLKKERIVTDLVWLSCSFIVKNLASSCASSLMMILQDDDSSKVCRMEAETLGGAFDVTELLNETKNIDLCVKESLRLWPPSLMVCRGVIEEFQMPLDSYIVEQGFKMWFHLQRLNRDPRIYEDPDAFKPQRWKDECLTDATFGVFHQRSCLGKPLTLVIVKLFVTMFLRMFPLSTIVDSNWRSKMKYLPVARCKEGSWVKVSP